MSEKKQRYDAYHDGDRNAFPIRVRPKNPASAWRPPVKRDDRQGPQESQRAFMARVNPHLKLFAVGDVETGSCPFHGGGVRRVYNGMVFVCLACYPEQDPEAKTG